MRAIPPFWISTTTADAPASMAFSMSSLTTLAAVSRMDVFTRQAGCELGASLSLEGGVPGPVEAAGCPEGTTLVVRD